MDAERRFAAGIGFDRCQPVYYRPASLTDTHRQRNTDADLPV
jgi:hypothetical protein